jgi:iron complex outermembrane receptor protein
MKAQLAAAGVTTFNMGHYYSDLPPNDLFTKRRKLRVAGGFDGKFDMFDSPWTYDGYAGVSWGMINNVVPHTTANLAMSMAMDSIIDPTTGRAICNPANVGFTTGKVGVNLVKPPSACVPFNPFGIGVNNEAAIAWVMGTPNMYFHLKQEVAAINFRGEPFSTWAGPVSLAVGAEHRKESADGTSDGLSQNRAWFIGNYNPTVGAYSITEAYAETVIPLAANTAWADSLDLNAAGRAQNYSTSGMEYTWKLGLTYAPVADVRFRVTRSRDVREPTLLDLYAPGTTMTGGIIDPANNNTNAQVQTVGIGNTALLPERADTTGFGVVLKPRFLPGFGASVDYYAIDIQDGINTIAAGTLVELCYSQQQYCSSIIRSSTPPPGGTVGAITRVTTQPINFGTQEARGIDFEASYTMPLSDLWDVAPGRLTFRALATRYLKSLTDSGVPGSIPLEAVGGTTLPKLRYQARAGYSGDVWSGELAVRGISSGVLGTNFIECTSGCPTSTTNNPTININHYDAAHYFDAAVNYKFTLSGSAAEVFFNVRNLLNTDGGIIPAGPGGVPDAVNSTSANLYDTMGRVYRVGLRVRM